MAVGLRFDGVDDTTSFPDETDWDIGDTEDLSMAFWIKKHPSCGRAALVSRADWFELGLIPVDGCLRPRWTMTDGETIIFNDVDIQAGEKTHIGFTLTTPNILNGDRSKVADTNTAKHLLDADGTDWTGIPIAVGDIAYNVDDGIYGVVTAVAAHDLTLDSDAFPDGNEVYLIIAAESRFVARLYQNGRLVVTESYSDYAVLPAAAATAIYVGSNAGASEWYKGLFNELVLTADVLTPAEMLYLYNNGTEIEDIESGSIGNMGHWSFDENTGTTIDEDGNDASKDGTVAGTELWMSSIDTNTVKDGILLLTDESDYYMDWLKIKQAQWVNTTNAAHLASITDKHGSPIWDWRSATADQSVRVPLDIWAHGVIVDDLDSGYLRLFVE